MHSSYVGDAAEHRITLEMTGNETKRAKIISAENRHFSAEIVHIRHFVPNHIMVELTRLLKSTVGKLKQSQ